MTYELYSRYYSGIHIILIELYNVCKGIRIVIENIYFF